MTFADELRNRAEYTRKVDKTINAIRKKLEEIADEGGYYCHDVYRLEKKPTSQHEKYNCGTAFDQLVVKKLLDMGLKCEVVYVDLNPHPEFGQEGFDACYRVDVSWTK